MKFHQRLSRIMVIVPVLLAACYPEGPQYTNDTDVVLTNFNPSYNFKSKGKFSIPDKIVKITGNVLTGDPPKYIPAPLPR